MDKVALITGGSQGIGKAMARAFGKAGYFVSICSRTISDVENASKELSAEGISCEGFALDVGRIDQVEEEFAKAAKRLGRIDVLVSCAGIYGPIGPLDENDLQGWEQAIRVNLCGTAFCVRAALPVMKKQGSGCIITLAGGGVGGKSIKPNFSAYITSKFGVAGFTEAIAAELEGTGITINAISPGAVNTRLLDQVLTSKEKAGKFYEDSLRQKQEGGTPPKLACELALYLAGEGGRKISGRLLSAIWDKKESLSAIEGLGKSRYTLRRIDGELFCEAEK